MGFFDSESSDTKTKLPFKVQYNAEERQAQFNKVSETNPGKIPVICERAKTSTLPDMDKTKYLVPGVLGMSQFIGLIRKRIKLTDEQAIFVYAKGEIPKASETMAEIYEKYKDEDGFLYLQYTGENTFGSL